ncbi:centromere protein S-like [Corticium candelabrum]|uniref:centromere protein S-like n=1 Tax=Corticium candelabrum TaxID=121492 RepID=UPI002E259645|nr:centromere protein S-like [Corticium candelabrum]
MEDVSDGETDRGEDLEYRQRLKAAVHYTVGKICEEVTLSGFAASGTKFSRQYIAMLSETTFKQCETLATDLESFAKHARRSTVNSEDVKLSARRNESLRQHIESMADERARAHESERAARRGKKQQKKTDSEER